MCEHNINSGSVHRAQVNQTYTQNLFINLKSLRL